MIEDLAVRLAAIERLAKAAYRAPAAGNDASMAYAAARALAAEFYEAMDGLVGQGTRSPISVYELASIRSLQPVQMRNLEALAGFRGTQDQRSRRAAFNDLVINLDHTRARLGVDVE